jgi:hypothetical protein
MASPSGGFTVQDANLSVTLALPNAASTTVNSNSIDTRNSSLGDFLARSEVLVSAPALNTTILPDTKTMTYNLIASNNSNMSGNVTLATNLIVQTGASGAGAAAATGRFRLPSNVTAAYGRYIAVQAVSGANTTNASTKNVTIAFLM